MFPDRDQSISDGTLMKGKLGADLDTEEGKLAARQVGLTMLSTIKDTFRRLKKNQASGKSPGNGQQCSRL